MRVGQKNGLVYQWAKKGSRPRQPKDQRYENAYLFGAVCPGRNTGIAVIMPQCRHRSHAEACRRISLRGKARTAALDQADVRTHELSVPGPLRLDIQACRPRAPD